jgi:hypothetical protein
LPHLRFNVGAAMRNVQPGKLPLLGLAL